MGSHGRPTSRWQMQGDAPRSRVLIIHVQFYCYRELRASRAFIGQRSLTNER
jgi:hypothetical protein